MLQTKEVVTSILKNRVSSMTSTDSLTTRSSSESSFAETFEEQFVERLGKAMESVAGMGDSLLLLSGENAEDSTDVFTYSFEQSKISLRSYLKMILKSIDGVTPSLSWSKLSPGARALIVGVIYIDRIVSKTGLIVNSKTIHRLVITGMLVALKMNEDASLDMHYYSTLCGLPFNELRDMEKRFLEKLNWETYVSALQFNSQLERFERYTTNSPRRKRY